MNNSAAPLGRRARKRRATENAIEDAAVTLALKHGMDQVTVDEICARADVSRSTFFNYFATREAAIIGRVIEIPVLSDAFPVLDSCPDDLPRGLYRLFFAAVGHNFVDTKISKKRHQLSQAQPEAAQARLTMIMQSAITLTNVASAWLEKHPHRAVLDSHEQEASFAAGIVIRVINAIFIGWAEHGDDFQADDAAYDHYLAQFRQVMQHSGDPAAG